MKDGIDMKHITKCVRSTFSFSLLNQAVSKKITAATRCYIDAPTNSWLDCQNITQGQQFFSERTSTLSFMVTFDEVLY